MLPDVGIEAIFFMRLPWDAPPELAASTPAYTARVVAGTFEFAARERGGAATSTVTEGRFDCKF